MSLESYLPEEKNPWKRMQLPKAVEDNPYLRQYKNIRAPSHSRKAKDISDLDLTCLLHDTMLSRQAWYDKARAANSRLASLPDIYAWAKVRYEQGSNSEEDKRFLSNLTIQREIMTGSATRLYGTGRTGERRICITHGKPPHEIHSVSSVTRADVKTLIWYSTGKRFLKKLFKTDDVNKIPAVLGWLTQRQARDIMIDIWNDQTDLPTESHPYTLRDWGSTFNFSLKDPIVEYFAVLGVKHEHK